MKAKKKPGPPVGFPSELEIVVRRWPYLPDYVQRSLVEMVSHYGPPPVAQRFPTPEGSDWPDVQIVLLDDSTARVTVGAVQHQYTFSALGLAGRRYPSRPRAEWRMLQTYAENPEPDAYYKLPYRESLKVEISKFRRWLQGFFGLPGDPLKPFKPALWLPRFKISTAYNVNLQDDSSENDADA